MPDKLPGTLKTLMAAHGWTQEEFAAKVGISQPHISRIMRGLHRPSSALLEKMARVLRVSMTELQTGEPHPTEVERMILDAYKGLDPKSETKQIVDKLLGLHGKKGIDNNKQDK